MIIAKRKNVMLVIHKCEYAAELGGRRRMPLRGSWWFSIDHATRKRLLFKIRWATHADTRNPDFAGTKVMRRH
jgi:hypothetical protein